MNKRLVMITFLLLPMTSFGDQRIPVQDGVTAEITISTRGLNHIAIEDDRILSVKGSSSEFQLDKDEILGHIYIQPEQNSNDPIQLFLTTEKQHTLSVVLLPANIPAESIMLVLDKEKKIAEIWEQSQPYEVVLTSIIKAMYNQETLEGYSIDEINTKSRASNGLDVLHLKSYRGKLLRGEVLQVSNSQKEPINIIENDFYKPGVRAVAISNSLVPPKGQVTIFLVKENG